MCIKVFYAFHSFFFLSDFEFENNYCVHLQYKISSHLTTYMNFTFSFFYRSGICYNNSPFVRPLIFFDILCFIRRCYRILHSSPRFHFYQFNAPNIVKIGFLFGSVHPDSRVHLGFLDHPDSNKFSVIPDQTQFLF